jgi:hypothetical protein
MIVKETCNDTRRFVLRAVRLLPEKIFGKERLREECEGNGSRGGTSDRCAHRRGLERAAPEGQ